MMLAHPIEKEIINPFNNTVHIKTIRRAEVIKYEEKGSDVNIATSILTDAFEGKYDVAVLISNDSDLVAPLKYVKSKLGKKIIILNPQEDSSSILKRYGTYSKNISEENLVRSLFPEKLKDINGTFNKPCEWNTIRG